jgi:hypothetical protein
VVSYRYRVGDRVLFHPHPSLSRFAGAYLIERHLPVGDSGPTYLVKRGKDGHRRTVSEAELAPIPIADPVQPEHKRKAAPRRR